MKPKKKVKKGRASRARPSASVPFIIALGSPPKIITEMLDVMFAHYSNYMDEGGSHAEYMAMNDLSESQADGLWNAYKARKKEKRS